MKRHLVKVLAFALMSGSVVADEVTDVQDMSDPLAVFTQLGAGVADRGINLKMGQTFDTGSDTTMGMNVLEVKGIYGDALGFRDNTVDSVDSVRLRHVNVDLINGRGAMLDADYNFNDEVGNLSYSLIQALPALGPVQFFPLAGAGVTLANNALGDDGQVISGYSMPGTFALVGTYSKIDITDKIWLNYNPMWLTSLSGSDVYKNHAFEGDSSVFRHEFAASYQFTPRFNVRYFANWTENTKFKDGEHRIEFNYQL